MNKCNDDDSNIDNDIDNTPKHVYLWTHVAFFLSILLTIPFLYMSTQITRENIKKLPLNLINYKPSINHIFINNVSTKYICYSETDIFTSSCLHQIKEPISINLLQNLIQKSINNDENNFNLFIVDRNAVISNNNDKNSYELILFDNNNLYDNDNIFDYDNNFMNFHPIGICIFAVNETNQQIESMCKQMLHNKVLYDINKLEQNEIFRLSQNNIITLDIATEDGYLSNEDLLSINFFENIITRNIMSISNFIPMEINVKVSRFPNLEKYYYSSDFSNCRYRYIKGSDGEKVIDSIISNDLCIDCNHINIIIYIPSVLYKSELIVDESDNFIDIPLLFMPANKSFNPCITSKADDIRDYPIELVTGIITSPKKSMLILNSMHGKLTDEILLSSLNLLRDQVRIQLLSLNKYETTKHSLFNSCNSDWLSPWELMYLKIIWSKNMLFNSIKQLNSLELHLNSNSNIEVLHKIQLEYDLAVSLLSLSLDQYIDASEGSIYALNETFFINIKTAYDLTQKLLADPSLVPKLSFPLEQVISLTLVLLLLLIY